MQIPPGRIEAFSDGVIAIIITVMVFDLKLNEIQTANLVWLELINLLPKFTSYALSFLMVAIMWVNHHHLFHQIRHSDRALPWYNILLLFWMSLIPFVTNFIGTNPLLWQSSFLYGIIFSMCALSFNLLRHHTIRKELIFDHFNRTPIRRIIHKNLLAISIFAIAGLLGLVSVYISFVLFLLVPAMYFVPPRFAEEKSEA